jgi:hypothetical protein
LLVRCHFGGPFQNKKRAFASRGVGVARGSLIAAEG